MLQARATLTQSPLVVRSLAEALRWKSRPQVSFRRKLFKGRLCVIETRAFVSVGQWNIWDNIAAGVGPSSF